MADYWGLMNTGMDIHVCMGIDHEHGQMLAWTYGVGLTQYIKSYAHVQQA